jgi:hypothetical protein
LKLAFLQELELPVPENEDELKDDPYLSLGYGCNAYYDIVLASFKLFVFCSFACIPLFYIYSANEA